MPQDPHRPRTPYSLLTEEGHAQIPDPSVPLAAPRQPPVPELLTQWARDTPTQAAVQQGAQQWSYRNLVAQAEKVGQALAAGGVKAGTVVALSGRPSFGLIVGLLGVLQRGGVLLIVDPALPAVRKSLMLHEAKAQVLLLLGQDDTEVSWVQPSDIPQVHVSPNTGHVQPGDTPVLLRHQCQPAGDPAYIFFTSGTTGTPKGIVGSNQSLSHFLTWQRATFAIGPDDRVAQLTGLSFDAVLRDIFLPLTSGGVLCLPEESDRTDGGTILHWLEREQITILHTVPTVAQYWLTDAPSEVELSHLRWVFFSGEPLTDGLIYQWRAAFPQSGHQINLYGTTETTLVKSFYQIPTDPPVGVQPIGSPLPQTQLLVVTPRQQLCGIGELGEIVIRTPFRTLGYLNAAPEQAQCFRPNPFTQDPTDVWYWTGDQGRYRLDGTVEILGRRDDQVKVRGVRIEPGEVMSVLNRMPQIRSSFVTGRKTKQDETVLVAYVVPTQPGRITASEIRTAVNQTLPPAFVPNVVTLMEELPRSPTGKVDRSRLPEPDWSHAPYIFVAPRTPEEEVLLEVWREILKIDHISVHDNFFELGGHSLSAIQVVARLLNILKIDVPLRTLFDHPTIAQLAQELDKQLR